MQPTAKDYAEEAKWRKALEPIIREQIAREIEAKCHDFCGITYNCSHDSSQIVACGRGCSHAEDAAIARGEK